MDKERMDKSNSNANSLGITQEEEELLLKSNSVNFRLSLACFIIAFGSSFQFGYNIGVVNAPGLFITNWMGKSHLHLFGHKPTPEQETLIFSVSVSIFAVGGMIGGLLVGYLADRLGRKTSLHWNNILSLLAGILMIVSYYLNIYPIFHLGRFIIGINAGLSSGLVPMLLCELSPIKLRGMFGSIPQLIVTISILIAQIVGLPFLFGTEHRWIFMFAFILIPSILQLIGLFFVPESPKYTLLFLDNFGKSLADLIKFRESKEVAKVELKMYEHEKNKTLNSKSLSIKQLLFSQSLKWTLLLSILLMAFQQLSGINAVMFYSTQIFTQAGLGSSAVYATIGMALLNVITTILSIYLVDHPRFGRRLLLSVGKMGMAVASIGLVTSIAFNKRHIAESVSPYFSVFFLLAFVFFFACGPGSIPFFYINEIFYSDARGSANSIGVCANWSFNFLVSLTFLPINNILQEFTFLIFAVVCLVAFAFIVVYLPETKARPIEEVQVDLKRRQPKIFNESLFS